jgi:sortase A
MYLEIAQHRAYRWLDRALIAFGIACLIVYAVFTAQAALYQRQAKAEIDRMIAARRLSEGAAVGRPLPDVVLPSVPIAPGDIIGRVDVPRLNLSAVVAEGDDESTLRKAVGHLSDTPLPWQQGNVAFAAHRDTLFRPLRNIRINDEVRVVTAHGEFLYRVRHTQIVDPEDVRVLAPTPKPSLTLITCYPFYFVGNAPQRFVVQAERDEPELTGVALTGTVVQ